MQTIQQTYRTSFRERGSKFIGRLFPAQNGEVFEKKLSNIQSEYPDATHHCYAWRMGATNLEEFAQDDGEPSGTAGLPILNQLKSFKAVNCGCVVVRYYGGTNLGKPGLIKAYAGAAKQCLLKASFLKLIPTQNFRIIYNYSDQNEIDQLKNFFDLKEMEAEYLEDICLEVACRKEQSQALWNELQQREHLGITAEKLGEGFVTIE